MGRHPLPIEPYMDKLIQAIVIGASYELAAKFAGISYKTFERWRQQAEHARPGTPLAELRERLSEAEGRAAVGWLAKIERAANEGDWRAAAFKLERRYPETYGRSMQKIAFTDPSGAAPAPPPAVIPETFFTDLAAIYAHLAPQHYGELHDLSRGTTNGTSHG